MKNTFFWINYSNFKTVILRVIRRFPLSIILLLLLTLLLLIKLNASNLVQYTNNVLNRGIFSIIITFFLSVGFYLKGESLGFSDFKKILVDGGVIVFGILFFIFFKNNVDNIDNLIFFTLTLVGIISFLFVSPFIEKIYRSELNEKIYYGYFYNISVIFLVSFILGGVLTTLGNIGILAYFTLFDIKGFESHKFYWDWTILSLALITPIFALIQIPEKETFDKNKFLENAFFSFLVKNISIPFICVYFIILYSYTIRVLLNFKDWPKGEVTWLVIGFSIFGYLIYIFSYLFEDKNKFIKIYRTYFPIVVIPQLFMPFYAIYLRIAQYDITMNRYFVVVFGIWLSVISLYFVFSKKKNIAYIPLILTIFTIIISIGPWGVYTLPESRQLTRLENNLKNAGILKNGVIFPLKNYNDISIDLSKEIYSQITYLCNYDNCSSIKKIFPDQYKIVKKKNINDRSSFIMRSRAWNDNTQEYEPTKWVMVQGITKEIKVKNRNDIINNTISSSVNNATIIKEILNFTNKYSNSYFPIDVTGYSKILNINTIHPLPNPGDFVVMEIKYHIMYVYKKTGTIDSVDLKEIENKLLSIYKKTGSTKLDSSDMIFELKGKKNGEIYKIFLENISIKNSDYRGVESKYPDYSASGYVLMK